ncbi:MAG: type II toxin-antitoxin system RelE/ParE family toxin [Armatimonadetes bacterium]|nr:type II toxin-antitoxin system RelE/ParE family toxin [Armatimonadota bacterium]
MRFRFQDSDLEALYYQGLHVQRYKPEVVRSFYRVMAQIDAAQDERDLYALKGLHFEKLTGNRAGQHSLRLNDQYRLIVELTVDADGKLILVIAIEDYH